MIAHELGHHADWVRSDQKGRYFGGFSIATRKRCAEAPITSYCPNDAEWFAEMFRLDPKRPVRKAHEPADRNYRESGLERAAA